MHHNTKFIFAIAFLSAAILFAGGVFAWVNPNNFPGVGVGGLKPGVTDPTKVGIALSDSEEPQSALSVGGALSIGSSYIGITANGNNLLTQGNVAIGRPTAIAKLSVNGGITLEGISQRFFPNTKIPTQNFYYRLPNPTEVISGGYLALTIGRDGMPVFVYVDDGRIKVGHCTIPDCSNPVSISDLDLAQGIGNVSISIGQNGYPIIAGIASGPKLIFYACYDYECKNSTYRDLDTINVLDLPTSITTQSNGFPAISYRRGTTSAGVYLILCENISCENPPNPVTISTLGSGFPSGDEKNGTRAQLALGSDGLLFTAYFVYYDVLAGAQGIYFKKCTNMECTSSVTNKLINNALNEVVGEFASVTVGSDGFPLITVYHATNGRLMLLSCKDINCTPSLVTVSTVSSLSEGDVGKYSSITTSIDGLPLIAYQSKTAQALYVRKCGNKECTISHGTPLALDLPASLGGEGGGKYASIGLGVDGLPVVTFLQTVGGQNTMYFLKCGSENCLPYWSRR